MNILLQHSQESSKAHSESRHLSNNHNHPPCNPAPREQSTPRRGAACKRWSTRRSSRPKRTGSAARCRPPSVRRRAPSRGVSGRTRRGCPGPGCRASSLDFLVDEQCRAAMKSSVFDDSKHGRGNRRIAFLKHQTWSYHAAAKAFLFCIIIRRNLSTPPPFWLRPKARCYEILVFSTPRSNVSVA